MPHRLEQRAEEIISHDVLAAPANAPIQEVVRAMVDRGKDCVIVVDQGQPVGIVLERDLLPLAVAEGTPRRWRCANFSMTRHTSWRS